VADVAGWRAIFLVAAAGAAVLAVSLYRALPPLAPKTRLPYRALIASVAVLAMRERTVRWTLVLGATGFAAFTMFWTSLTFLLSAPPFSYPVSVIGLFGLAGLVGALAAQRAGRLHDRGWSLPATGVAWLVVLVSFVVAGLAGSSVAVLLVAVVGLDAALQGLAILNQTRVFAVSREARSRINTAFVVCNFVGAALGSAAATTLWSTGGWTAVTTAGVVLSCVGLTIWATGRRSALVVATSGP
jgi:predicted MFS family arabinose efflux permease